MAMSETIQTKRCCICKQSKSISEFHKNRNTKDGLKVSCKICANITNSNYRKTSKGQATQKRHRQSEKGKVANHKAGKKYQKTTKGKATHRKAIKKYLKTEKGKAKIKRYYVHYPERLKAKRAISNAIRSDKLPRPDTLQCHYYLQNPDCEKQAQQYHHHKGYAPKHWLDVIPVCIPCHNKSNRKIA